MQFDVFEKVENQNKIAVEERSATQPAGAIKKKCSNELNERRLLNRSSSAVLSLSIPMDMEEENDDFDVGEISFPRSSRKRSLRRRSDL